MADELDLQALDSALKDITASNFALGTAIAALISTHPDKQSLQAAFEHHLPPQVRTTANAGNGHNTKQLLSWFSTALKGGFQKPR